MPSRAIPLPGMMLSVSKVADGPAPDIPLVQSSQQGDSRAFGELVRRHQDRVFNLALRMTGDRDLAADVAQDAFLRAFRSLPKLRQPERFGSWLLKIVSNLSLDALSARGTVSLDALLEDSDEHLPVSNQDPAEQVAGILSDEAVAAALGRVPPVYRQVLVLRHIEDLPYEQIAEILDIPLGTVKTRLFRGREQLRQLLIEGEMTP